MLGLLNEALLRLSAKPDLSSFWTEVCESARWIVPGLRLYVALAGPGAELSAVARCAAGKIEVGAFGAILPSDDPLGRALRSPQASFVSGPWDGARGVDAGRAWLLGDDPPLVLQAPIESRKKVIGRLIFAMADLREADQRAALAAAKAYALHVGLTYTMLKTILDLEAAGERLEAKNAELERIQIELHRQVEVIEAQHQAMIAMSTPIIQVWDRVLTLPVIGTVDDARAIRIVDELLRAVVRERARFTILDLTGAVEADASTLSHLLRMVRMVELLGCRCLLSGIPPTMASRVVGLGIDLDRILAFGTLRAALEHVERGA